MRIIILIILLIISLLSIAAGTAKVMQMQQEIDFFQSFGFSANIVVSMGILQIVGGVLLLIPKTRTIGSALVALCFCGSAIMVFMNGQIGFGLFSLIPAILAVSLPWLLKPKANNK